jgi:hypothetical protein
LAVCAILLAAGVNAEPAEFTEDETGAERNEDGYGKDKDYALEESGHSHHLWTF